jgi:hypothetical protein
MISFFRSALAGFRPVSIHVIWGKFSQLVEIIGGRAVSTRIFVLLRSAGQPLKRRSVFCSAIANHLALLPRKTGVAKPRFLGMPALDRPNSAACPLGRYCNRETAPNTFVFASQDTLQVPFTTRDTVAVETPASLATSLTVHARTSVSVDALIIVSIWLEGENRFHGILRFSFESI